MPLEQFSLFDTILMFCNLLGVAPPIGCTWKYRVFAIMALILSTSGAIVSFMKKLGLAVTSCVTVIKIEEAVANVFLTLAVTTTVVLTVIVLPGKLQEIRESLLRFDETLDAKHAVGNLKIITGISCMILFLTVFSIMALDTWVWLDYVTMTTYIYFITRNVQFFQITAIMLLWFWIAMQIFYRFALLNGILETLATHPQCFRNTLFVQPLAKRSNFGNDVHKALKNVTENHNFLCGVVDDVNELFGLILSVYVIVVIAFIVEYTTVLIFHEGVGMSTNDVRFGGKFAFIGCFWILVYWVEVVGVSIAGHFVGKEANRTVTICHNLLNDLKTDTNYQQLKEELQDLSEQVTRRNPRLSASGFGVVNLSTLSSIISSVTSYIIIAIQFFPNNNE